MGRFVGKKVLITGGSRGIGYATAKAFLDEGAEVVITGRGAGVVAAADRLGAGAHPLVWDIRDIEQLPAKVEEAIRILGGLDAVINNAGVLTGKDNTHTFETATVEDFTAVMEVNLRGVFFMCQYACAYMKEHHVHGHIVNVCSNMGFRMISDAPYGISKWAVRGLTMGLGRSAARYGVIVNAVAPGPVTTEMMNFQEGMENHFPHIPIERYSTPEEVAKTILFLAESENIVGEVVVTDGGERLY